MVPSLSRPLLLLGTAIASVTTPADGLFVGGGLTILSRNDLDGAPNDGSAAILVHQPAPFLASSTSCTLLGETPWHPEVARHGNGTSSTSNSTSSRSTDPHAVLTALAYQQFQGAAPAGQQYWVGKAAAASDACRAIRANGSISAVDCQTALPMLCTQSAPLSSTSAANTSAAWRVTQSVNGTLLTGYRDLHVWKFRGVRYAVPPARFAYAQRNTFRGGDDGADDAGPILAVDAGADCSQPVGEVRSGSSEDCLFANVWTPYLPRLGSDATTAADDAALKPVMLYLYGGGFTSGSGKNPNTDGTNLASRGDVVVVSVNYRVGNAGFLAFDDGVHRGNYALSDMVAALEWVRDYIRFFGGDASRVTLFGESAGAQATHILLGSPRARGLFHRAVMQSDPQGWPRDGRFAWMAYDSVRHSYETQTKRVLRAAGCGNLTDAADAAAAIACLGRLDGFALANLTVDVNSVVVDGVYLTEPWLVVNRTGLASNVSVMTGVNRDEAGVLVDDYPANGTSYATYLTDHVGDHFGLPRRDTAALAASPDVGRAFGAPTANVTQPVAPAAGATAATIFNASMAIATDGVFTCFDLAKVYSAVRHGAFGPTYAFEFNRTYQPRGYSRPWCVPPATAARPHGDPDREYYKCHAGEQLVVFATEARDHLPDRDGRDVPFMQLVVDYWSSFARHGNPNPPADYLTVRRFWGTLAQSRKTGSWLPVTVDPDTNATARHTPTKRLLQWDGHQVPLGDVERCAALGIPLDVLETYDKA